jgi:hypothetical protein
MYFVALDFLYLLTNVRFKGARENQALIRVARVQLA